jgi:hypothetical protein
MRLRPRTGILVAVLVSARAAPGTAIALASAKPNSPPLEFLHVGAVGGPAPVHQIVDGQGRQVLLLGVNVDGLAAYYRPDLRTPLG